MPRGAILTGLTLGLYYPTWITRRQAFLTSNSYFGSQAFRFDGHGRDLRGRYLISLLLLLPTIGLSWIWFVAARRRYFWARTSFGEARFHYDVHGSDLLLLWMSNAALTIGTLGLAYPWVVLRNVRFVFQRLTLQGPLDLTGVVQDPRPSSATGEGLAGFVDTGLA